MNIFGTSNTTSTASIGTSFDKTKAHLHNLNGADPKRVSGQTFRGVLGAILVDVAAISTAATLTIRLTRDADGDKCIIPDVSADLAVGVTTATEGSAVFKMDIPYVDVSGLDTLYLMVKTDAGTVTLAASSITWAN